VAVALSVSYFFSSFYRVKLPVLYWIALGLTVWLIYLVDHVADSYLPGSYTNKTELHRLRGMRNSFTRISSMLALSLIVITFLLPFRIVLFGLFGVLFMLAYTILNQVQNYSLRAFFLREPFISLFFIVGTAGVPLLYAGNVSGHNLIFLSAVFLLILTNTIIFACVEYQDDIRAGVKTIAVRFGAKKTRLIGILTGLGSTGLFIYFIQFPAYSAFGYLGIAMTVPLLIMLLLIRFVQKHHLDFLADLILILPLILLLPAL